MSLIWRWLFKAEYLLTKAILSLCLLIGFVQCAMFSDTFRPYFSRVDILEGKQIIFEVPLYAATPLKISDSVEVSHGFSMLRNSKVIIIHMIKPVATNLIFVTLNGKVVDDFRKGEVKVTVFDGDYIEINATNYTEPAQFVVNTPNEPLLEPTDGLLLVGKSTIITVGTVKIKP